MTYQSKYEWLNIGPIREAVVRILSKNTTKTEICNKLGWVSNNGRSETSRLDQTIGIKNKFNNKKTMRYDNAVKIIRAIDRDPVEFGL